MVYWSLVTAALLVSIPRAGIAGDFEEHVRSVESALDDCGSEGDIARETAFNALSNSLAALNDAQTSVREALRGGKREVIKAARRELDDAWSRYSKTLDATEEIARYTALSSGNAETASGLIEQAFKTVADSERKKCMKKAERSLAAARRAVSRAKALADELKARWLIPTATSPQTAQ